MKNKIIGIDPDIEKSGVCYLYTPTRQVEVQTMDFPHLLEYLSTFESDCNVVVIVEASWKSRHNWHLKFSDNKYVASAKGYSEGQNHQLGKLIVEMCQYWGIPVEEKTPLRKMWKGQGGKITQWEIEKFIPGFPKRSNQEARDATLLAWDHAGFPIRIAPKASKTRT